MIDPSTHDAGWRGSELTDPASWTVQLDTAIAEQLADHARTISRNGTAPAAPLPSQLTDGLLAARHDLLHGRGFVLIRGLPVDELDDAENEILCTAIGSWAGVPIRQNLAGDHIVRVRDEGKDFTVTGVRSYETAAPLDYHSDSSDVVGLYCLRAAQTGGASTIVSSVAVHAAMWQTRPDLAELLHQPWATPSIIERTVHHTPICAVNDAGEVFTRYGRMYLETASEYDATIPALRTEQVEALDLYDSFLTDPAFALDMNFQPGDLQLLNNYRIMHARHPYVDWPDPEQRRTLLRLWLVVEDLDVPEVFEDSGFVPRAEALG